MAKSVTAASGIPNSTARSLPSSIEIRAMATVAIEYIISTKLNRDMKGLGFRIVDTNNAKLVTMTVTSVGLMAITI